MPQKLMSFNLEFDNNFNIKKGKVTDKGEDRSGVSYGGENVPGFRVREDLYMVLGKP